MGITRMENSRGHLILGTSLVLAATVFGIFFYQSRIEEKTVRVVGAATTRFTSDVVKWRLELSRNVGVEAVRQGYLQVGKDVDELLSVLRTKGVHDNEINIQPATAQPRYRQYGEMTGYIVQQSLFIVSTDMDRIESLALNPGAILSKGVILQSTHLEYLSSKLSDIKRELFARATADAQIRAGEIAGTAGLSITTMESARAGVFQITEPYSNEVTDYGVYNTATREKDITVTVSATFIMK